MGAGEPWRRFDAVWFERWQWLLLLVLEEPILGQWFRWVLCIRRHDVGYARPIVKIFPHGYVVRNWSGSYTAELRTHWKYAKRIYCAFAVFWWMGHLWDWAVADRWVPDLSVGMSTLTAYPDAGDPGATTVDGTVSRTGVSEVWATIRDSASGTAKSATATPDDVGMLKMALVNSQWDTLARGFFTFDTTVVSAPVTNATVSLWGDSAATNAAGEFALHVAGNTQASATTLALADYSAVARTSFGKVAGTASWLTAAYNNVYLNPTGVAAIVAGGITKLSTQLNPDLTNIEPVQPAFGAVSKYSARMADAAGTANDPKLTVSYGNGLRVEAQLQSGAWTLLNDDVLISDALAWRRGMSAGGPLDRIAVTGTLQFSLRNDAQGVRLQGWYSPQSANVRPGWTYGIPIRVVYALSGTNYGQWRGKLWSIDPAPGLYQERIVRCQAVDAMNDLAENDARSVTPQVSQTENAIIAAVIAAMPTNAQPTATSYDASLDTYPYALDNASSDVKALSLIADVVVSAQAYAYVLGDGTFHIENRQARALAANKATFDDTTLYGIVVPSNLGNVYNHVRTTTHPRTIDAAATTVLFGISKAQQVDPGQSLTIWGDYTSPSNTLKLIGGTAQVVPIVSGTDYSGNAASDGSGANLTSSLSVTTSAFAASVKFVVTNNHATATIYLVTAAGVPLLQVRGKGVYDNAPVSFETVTTQSYGDRLLSVDLRYQDNGPTAQSLADYLEKQYDNLAKQIGAVEFVTSTAALLNLAVTGEIGNRLTISETMTGASSVPAIIQAIEVEVLKADWHRVRYVLAPRGPSDVFILDDAVFGVLDGANSKLFYA